MYVGLLTDWATYLLRDSLPNNDLNGISPRPSLSILQHSSATGPEQIFASVRGENLLPPNDAAVPTLKAMETFYVNIYGNYCSTF